MQEFNKNKIFWHSRRGMLELDLLLVPFAKEVFETLPHQEQAMYSEFLEEEDQDLFACLVGRQPGLESKFQLIIDKILAHKAASA